MMNKLRKFVVDFPLLSAIILVIIVQILFHLDIWFFHVHFFADICGINSELGEAFNRFICIAILLCFIVYFMKNSLSDTGYFTDNLGLGLKKGAFILFIPVLIGGLSLLNKVSANSGHWASTTDEKLMILIELIQCISVGIFEETAYRAIPINILRNRYGLNERQRMFFSIIISSILFGLIHLSNYFGGYDSLTQCIGRVINAAGFGVFLGAIYWTTGSLLSCILIHFIWDYIECFCDYIYVVPGSTDPAAISSSSIILPSILAVIYIIFGLRILRKKKYDGCKIKAATLRDML